MRTQIKDGKTFANINDLRLWPYNPKIIEDKDLERLKKQILELGVYKPLISTPDGEILGGNQRYKVLKELYKDILDYEWVWVSIVEAWSTEERLKYALSDNDTICKYNKEKLGKILPEINGQESLFSNYRLDLFGTKTLEEIKDDINLTEQELKAKNLKNQLLEAGLNTETAEAITQETKYHKNLYKIPDVEIKGEQVKERYMIAFWCDTIEDYNYLIEMYGTSRKFNFNTDKLLKFSKEKLSEFNYV